MMGLTRIDKFDLRELLRRREENQKIHFPSRSLFHLNLKVEFKLGPCLAPPLEPSCSAIFRRSLARDLEGTDL